VGWEAVLRHDSAPRPTRRGGGSEKGELHDSHEGSRTGEHGGDTPGDNRSVARLKCKGVGALLYPGSRRA
jgi:hypothetical protein